MVGFFIKALGWIVTPSFFVTKRWGKTLWRMLIKKYLCSLFFVNFIFLFFIFLFFILQLSPVLQYFCLPPDLSFTIQWFTVNYLRLLPWLAKWLIALQVFYIVMFFLLILSQKSFFFYGTKRAGWPDVKQELSRIEKKEHEFDNAIQSLAATKAHILQTWTKQTSAQNDEFTLHEGFPKFTHSILQELGLKLKYHYDNNSTPIEDRKLINITWTLNPDTAHEVLSCSFATATPLLHSLQQKLPVYNRDNPALWHKKFALPLLEFLQSLNGLTRFSWQFLNPETARKKIGWAPLRGTDQMEAYIAGTQEFTEQIRSILRPRAECVTQLMEVSSVPMVLALIEKDMSKHTFIGLSKPEIEAITRPDSSEPERHAESDAYSASWPFIHSTNDLVFEFYADLYESLVQDEEFRAEAVRVVNGIKGVRNHVSA